MGSFYFIKPGVVVVAPTCNPRTGEEETGELLAGFNLLGMFQKDKEKK